MYMYLDAGGQNKQHLASKNTAKLDRETEELHHEHVTLDTAKLIQQARQAKGWTQKDLATVSLTSFISVVCRWQGLFWLGQTAVKCHTSNLAVLKILPRT